MMNHPLSPPDRFFQAGGTLDPDRPSYVEREADRQLLELVSTGEYCNVLAPRQMGKSSLIVQVQQRLKAGGVVCASVDLTQIGTSGITAEQWYFGLVDLIGRELVPDKAVHLQEWWAGRSLLPPAQRFIEFFQQVVLREIPGQIVILVDEIDSSFGLPFSDDFFAAVRALFNARATRPENRRLTFVLIGVARPADLIKDPRRTPYNIGQTIDLTDFHPNEAQRLLPGLEQAFSGQSEAVLDRILYWTGGHPYLTQRVCQEAVFSGRTGGVAQQIDQLVERLFFREGRAGEEVSFQQITEYVRQNEHADEMLKLYDDILTGLQVVDDQRSVVTSQLKLSGLVRTTADGYLRVRNRIYAQVFDEGWVHASGGPRMPPGASGNRWIKPLAIAAILALVLVPGIIFAVRIVKTLIVGPPTPTPTLTATATPALTATPSPTYTLTLTPLLTSTPAASAIQSSALGGHASESRSALTLSVTAASAVTSNGALEPGAATADTSTAMSGIGPP